MLKHKNWTSSPQREELYFAIQSLDRFMELDMPIKDCLVDLIQRANEVIESEPVASGILLD